jgi:activator of HSP90 ATPase
VQWLGARALPDKPCSKTLTIVLKTTSKAFCALLLLRATSLGRVTIGQKFSDRMRTSLYQEIDFKAGAQRVDDALLDSKQFSALSGEPGQIDHKDNGVFSMFGGKIVGRNVVLIANQRIVQAWRPANWDPGAYSIVKFELKEQRGRTMRVLDHAGFPEGILIRGGK